MDFIADCLERRNRRVGFVSRAGGGDFVADFVEANSV
jgi:hypothetical protein